MSAIISSVLALLAQLAGVTSEVSVIGKIVTVLAELVPVLVQEAKDLVPVVKNIIAALSANPATTADQLASLQQLDAKVDADFEAAANSAEAEDGTADTPAAS